jgi:hypothetical protein
MKTSEAWRNIENEILKVYSSGVFSRCGFCEEVPCDHGTARPRVSDGKGR